MDGERGCLRRPSPKHKQWNDLSARVQVVRAILTYAYSSNIWTPCLCAYTRRGRHRSFFLFFLPTAPFDIFSLYIYRVA
jgi:hypothetical protein